MPWSGRVSQLVNCCLEFAYFFNHLVVIVLQQFAQMAVHFLVMTDGNRGFPGNFLNIFRGIWHGVFFAQILHHDNPGAGGRLR